MKRVLVEAASLGPCRRLRFRKAFPYGVEAATSRAVRSATERPYRFILVALAAIALVALVVATAKALVVLFGGILFAVALHSVACGLARRLRLPYGICFGAVALAVVASTIVMAVVAGPKLYGEGRDLMGMLPDALHDALTRLRQSAVARVIEPQSAVARPSADTWLSRVVSAMGTSLEILGGIAVIFFVGLYGAAKPSAYARTLLAVVPARHRVAALRAARAANHDLARWLFGRFVAMLFVGVSCGIAFAVLHVPLAMTLAVLAGVLTFVPYIGAILSGVPPTLLAFTHSPTTALAVVDAPAMGIAPTIASPVRRLWPSSRSCQELRPTAVSVAKRTG